MLFARGTSISFKQGRQSGANLGIVALAKTDNYRGALSVRPQKVEVCVCLLESKTNPIHESALSCFLLFLDHFTVLNKRTIFFIPITRKMQFCPVLACAASVSNRFFFFCSCPSFLDEPREETLATQASPVLIKVGRNTTLQEI